METSGVVMVSLKRPRPDPIPRINHDADEDDNHYDHNERNDRRGPQRRRRDEGPPGPPRRRFEEPPLAKLRRLILNIASSTKLPEDEAIDIVEYLRDQYDDEDTRSGFFDILVQLYVKANNQCCDLTDRL